VVFAESEVISLRARGGKDENHEFAPTSRPEFITRGAAGEELLGRVGLDPDLVFSAASPTIRACGGPRGTAGARFVNPKGIDMIYAGALGAAVYAAEYPNQGDRDRGATGAPQGGSIRDTDSD